MRDDFKISVVTPVFCAEEYINDAIDSVIEQTIGFEENIQLILVNDGSPDGSGEICKEYQKRYPNNIVYLEKENGGVSSARNMGIKYIKGTYTIFFDSDDIWDRRAFSRIYKFFHNNHESIDVCSCRMEYMGDFEGRKYPLDYKFSKGSRVVNLETEPTFISVTIGNSVFKSSAISDRFFDENVNYCEDSLYINCLLLKKMNIGVIANAIFYYRKNFSNNQLSRSIVYQDAWYFDVFDSYYDQLIKYAEKEYGNVPEMIQEVLFYDIKWRSYNRTVMKRFSESDKVRHIACLQEVLRKIDDNVILGARNLSQYRKLYYLNLKHDGQVIESADFTSGKFYLHDKKILSLKAGDILSINTISMQGKDLVIEGLSRLSCLKQEYRFFVRDNSGMEYPVSIHLFEKFEMKGLVGETIIKGEVYNVRVPLKRGLKISFLVDVCGVTIRLKPRCDQQTELSRGLEGSFCIKGDYIIKYIKGRLCIYDYSRKTHIASEIRIIKTILKKKGLHKGSKELRTRMLRRKLLEAKVEARVAFISARSEDKLLGNMQKVYDRLDLPKVVFAKTRLGAYPEYVDQARKLAATSKMVITDDYLSVLWDKKPTQIYIQLWHATGTGKQFGLDNTKMLPGREALYHKNYDLVTVSSERARDVFAQAFGISREKVEAIGVARTDDFFDDSYKTKAVEKVHKVHPELKNKQVILYTPTFRDIPGLGRTRFSPKLDFAHLSQELLPNQVFVLCPHPVMTEPILNGSYDNVLELRDVPTNDMMFVSDLMISDYSSTMFEYALLRKPMAFFCYDYGDYDRDFYLDFDHELPGPIITTEDALIDFIRQGEYPLGSDYDKFCADFVGACDGHSTDRIIRRVKDLYGKA